MIERAPTAAAVAAVFAGVALVAGSAGAQQPAPAQPGEPAPVEPQPEGEPPGEEAAPGEPEPAPGEPAPEAKKPARPQDVWRDIVVVPRKPVLKARRWELAPFGGLNVNDPLIGHWALGAEINYYLTEVLSVGAGGAKFFEDREDVDLDVRRTYRLAPRINAYDWGANLNFGYVPAYGKFTVLNEWLLHWEGFVSAGIGVVHSTIIPRQGSDPTFSTLNIAPSVGLGARFFANRWLSTFFVFRDFIFNDHFEPTRREAIEDAYCDAQGEVRSGACRAEAIDEVQDAAQNRWVHDIVFMAGASFFLPTDFTYSTFR